MNKKPKKKIHITTTVHTIFNLKDKTNTVIINIQKITIIQLDLAKTKTNYYFVSQ